MLASRYYIKGIYISNSWCSHTSEVSLDVRPSESAKITVLVKRV